MTGFGHGFFHYVMGKSQSAGKKLTQLLRFTVRLRRPRMDLSLRRSVSLLMGALRLQVGMLAIFQDLKGLRIFTVVAPSLMRSSSVSEPSRMMIRAFPCER